MFADHLTMTLTSPNLTIRRAASPDAAVLAAFAARSFEETFAVENTPEDMAAYLATAFGDVRQREEIEDPEGITLLAEEDGVLIGYAQVRREPPPTGDANGAAVELRRLYVDRPFQGRGLAQRLMHAAEDAARNLGGQTFWLGVWERNARAKAFYAKCGFVDVGSHVFVLGTDVQTDRVMVKPLVSA
jgi:GNAT superfamily N-acetyltransferase